jgi:hypothetical protein
VVRRRILIGVGVALCLGLLWCNRPARGTSIAGQFLDAKTGAPVAGVRIYVEYGFYNWGDIGNGRQPIGYAEGVSQSNGTFDVEAPWIKNRRGSPGIAQVLWVHKQYGWGVTDSPSSEHPRPRHMMIRVAPVPSEVDHLAHPKDSQPSLGPCAAGLSYHTDSCRRYVYGELRPF